MTTNTSAPICYLEIPAPNVNAAGLFYSEVFSWKIKPSNLTDKPYWEFSTGDGQLTGGLDPNIPVNDGGVILYLKVADIDAMIQRIRTCGGSVVRDKFDIGGGHGFSALFHDPNGNVLGLFSGR